MPKREKSSLSWPEVILSTRKNSNRISREVAAGNLKKIAPRLYTPRVKDEPEKIVRRNLWEVIGLLFPDMVIGQRTGFELKPTQDGTVYLTGPYPRKMELPGVTVRIVRGTGAVSGDTRFNRSL